ncbi:hypothetical protein F5884DRAFT_861275 [Xylogone sp. PMI_703]|nr:hypothetical protein F5884DRAFT_861275 [Xylogone sp. PMI_703]
MSVLEVCQLTLKDGLPITDPTLLSNLREVRSILQTNSRFYQDLSEPSHLYILGIWPTLAAHDEFLESPRKNEILGKQQDQTNFGWILHLNWPKEGIYVLPLDAPVLSIERYWFKSDVGGEQVGSEKGLELVGYKKDAFQKGIKYRNASSWRCPEEVTDQNEFMIFSGWNSVEEHMAFLERDRSEGGYERVNVVHLRNIEQ